MDDGTRLSKDKLHWKVLSYTNLKRKHRQMLLFSKVPAASYYFQFSKDINLKICIEKVVNDLMKLRNVLVNW